MSSKRSLECGLFGRGLAPTYLSGSKRLASPFCTQLPEQNCTIIVGNLSESAELFGRGLASLGWS
ncbi:hypothetical protein FHS21_002578 [Phyllobacterium trifolii]|uniref:Uncharacterized protein n=1 Tax=Phyllobacterium trifolii TaxID=300193 RepID=A0A839U8C7_9HYPH|nr:hypothetical protein [Phyllobacterium trifolii]